MSGVIQRLEIFGAGAHDASTGKLVVSIEDLDHIVEAFEALKDSNIVKPHLKLGHAEAQKWFGQKDGIPALGWITQVWREKDKLLANVENVPQALLDMIRARRFHNVSAEVLWRRAVEFNGKSFPRVLTAVALLGVEMPAVKDLAGLAEALFTNEPPPFEEGEFETFSPEEAIMPGDKDKPSAMFSQEQVDSLIAADVTAAVAEATAKFKTDVEAKDAEIKVLKTRAEGAETEVQTAKFQARTAQATSIVDTAIKDGKLLPKHRDFALAMCTSTEKVKLGEKGEEKPVQELFNEFLADKVKVIDLDEKGSGENKQVEFSTAAEEVDYKVQAHIKEHPESDYVKSLAVILEGDNELRNRYSAMQA